MSPAAAAVEVAGDHVGARLGQSTDDLSTEPTAGAGHDGAPAPEGDQLGERPVADVGHAHGRQTMCDPAVRSDVSDDADAIRRLLHDYGDAVLARDDGVRGERCGPRTQCGSSAPAA